ncbi:hypothetical protein AAFF_G00061280 [Aldrovandia affinis]|uniref:Uncharacterized protein n=1 Tax=Aldrovandia affinis TaxID=143900 RepID=A0AAD7RZU0_9TELE|nr:hypothetical protein AAFF_G00061280 [Aldrovandia affinis]
MHAVHHNGLTAQERAAFPQPEAAMRCDITPARENRTLRRKRLYPDILAAGLRAHQPVRREGDTEPDIVYARRCEWAGAGVTMDGERGGGPQ